MLCSDTNRVAISGSPSTCALDTSITPLPSFLLLAFLAVYLPTRFLLARRPSSFSSSGIKSSNDDGYSYSYSSPSESPARIMNRTGVLNKWIHWVYVVLVVCLLGLRVLEVARLVAAEMGVGLLAVTLVANVINVVMLTYCGLEMGRTRSIAISLSLVLFWALSTVLESIKVVRLASYNSVFPAKGTAYPSSDWLLDNGCMLGLLVVFFFIEGAYLVLRWRSSFIPSSTTIDREYSRERTTDKPVISQPRMMDGYDPVDPVVYLNERRTGGVIGNVV